MVDEPHYVLSGDAELDKQKMDEWMDGLTLWFNSEKYIFICPNYSIVAVSHISHLVSSLWID